MTPPPTAVAADTATEARSHRWERPWTHLLCALIVSCWAVFSWVPNHSTPWKSVVVSPADDAITHAEMIASAGEALLEGQFPVRETPHTLDAVIQRYAVYQFYSFLPYTFGGALTIAGINPYHALVIIVFLSFLLGYVGFVALSCEWGAGPLAAGLGALTYTLAPYHLTNWFGRSAFPELVCFGVIPWVFWASSRIARCFACRTLISAGLAWSSLILSHNIFHLWTLIMLALCLAYQKWAVGGRELKMWPVVAGYLLGLGLSLFFFAGPLVMGSKLVVTGTAQPFEAASFTPLPIVLSPLWAQVKEARGSPNMGLQIGWPVLLGFLLYPVLWGRRALRSGLLAVFVLSLFLVWSPFDLWAYMGPLQIIQFPYRLLMYATLSGCLLLSLAHQHVPPRFQVKVLPVLALVLAIWALDWKTCAAEISADSMLENWKRDGTCFRAGMVYLVRDQVLHEKYRQDNLAPGFKADGQFHFQPGPGKLRYRTSNDQPLEFVEATFSKTSRIRIRNCGAGTVLVLPSPWYPDLYEVKVNGAKANYGYVARLVALRLPAGNVQVEYRLKGVAWANLTSQAAWVFFAGLISYTLTGWRRRYPSAAAQPTR